MLKTKLPMMIVWGSDLTLYFNSAFTSILGATWPRVLGRKMPEVWAEAWPDICGFVERAWSGEAVLIEDFCVPTQRSGFADHGYFTFSYTPIHEGSELLGLLCVCQETTQTVLAELRLKQLQSELIHLSRVSAMETMASTLAHELNHPLAAVTNYLSGAHRILQSGATDKELKLQTALMEATSASERAGAIIRRTREMLQGRRARSERVYASRVISEAQSIALADEKHLGYNVTTNVSTELCVKADRVQIQQVLVNLLRNAVQAMEGLPTPQIQIEAAPRGDQAVFCVTDRGFGIPEAARATLFQPFTSTKENGLGVGLSICRTIVEAHHGNIWLEDPPGGGARVSFSLPVWNDGGQPTED